MNSNILNSFNFYLRFQSKCEKIYIVADLYIMFKLIPESNPD